MQVKISWVIALYFFSNIKTNTKLSTSQRSDVRKFLKTRSSIDIFFIPVRIGFSWKQKKIYILGNKKYRNIQGATDRKMKIWMKWDGPCSNATSYFGNIYIFILPCPCPLRTFNSFSSWKTFCVFDILMYRW